MNTARYGILFFLAALLGACSPPAPVPDQALRARTLALVPHTLIEPFGVAVRGGEVFVSDGAGGRIVRIGPKGEPQVFAEGFETPSQIAFAANGDLYVADSGAHSVRRVSPDGRVETVAGDGIPGFADGDARSARFRAPIGIAVQGNRVFVSDTYNDRIREIVDGRVSTVAGSGRGLADTPEGLSARFDTPTGLAIGADGSLLVCDTGNARIRAVRSGGGVTTIIGGGAEFRDADAASAGLFRPSAVAVSGDGSVWFTDGNAVRRVELGREPFVRTVSGVDGGYRDGSIGEALFNHPYGIAIGETGTIYVADSENRAVRILTSGETGREADGGEIARSRDDAAAFRAAAPARWPYEPPQRTREIAGTLGEIRGENDGSGDGLWFHNGLDIVGGYGETARFIRDEKVLRPFAAENFGTLRELLRMPSLGYIHIRLGRDASERAFDDPRFIFDRDGPGRPIGVRVPRGARFRAGEPIGTLNAMNHVHLVAGPSGSELNALAALELPGASDKIAPVVEKIELSDENFRILETDRLSRRITVVGKTRIVARAFDRMDGNADRRRLGIYRAGYQLLKADQTPAADAVWPIVFDRLPDYRAVGLVYDRGSRSGATGETVFRYIVTNEVRGDVAHEGFLDASAHSPGTYTLRVFAADYFGNIGSLDLPIEIAGR